MNSRSTEAARNHSTRPDSAANCSSKTHGLAALYKTTPDPDVAEPVPTNTMRKILHKEAFPGTRHCKAAPRRRLWRKTRRCGAFTLLEVLVAMALLAIVAGLSFSLMTATTSAWKAHKAKISAFAEARAVFEILTRRLSQATLNTHLDYDNRGAPTRYLRKSDLQFILGKAADLIPSAPDTCTDAVFFVAPLGITNHTDYQPLSKLLAACGFYIRFGDTPNRPAFLANKVKSRYRFRLYQFLQPGERLKIYQSASGTDWFRDDLAAWSFPMAENVIGLILRVRHPGTTTTQYSYDSRLNPTPADPPPTFNQLPPVVSATLMVIDEDSAMRLAAQYGGDIPDILPHPGAFSIPAQYDSDMAAWELKLRDTSPRVAFRTFTADIHLRGAKWSDN